jgi:hypothetical protein
LEHTGEKRETENQAFAGWLRDFQPDARHIGVELVLERVVVPLAKSRVLLVVADGMSWPVATELVGDLQAYGGVPLRPSEGRVPEVVSTLPSVTETSRASL